MRRYSRRSVGNIFFNKSKRALSKTTTKDGEDKKLKKKMEIHIKVNLVKRIEQELIMLRLKRII